jgi:hypothetical protein
MGELFVELPIEGESVISNGVYYGDFYTKYSPREFLSFLTENSRLKKVEALGVSGDGRVTYKLS